MAYKDRNRQRAASREHYERNKPLLKARARAFTKAQGRKLRDIVRALKARPCEDCGVQYPFYVMQFDHVRGQKDKNVASMVCRAYSLTRVMAEIAKCEVVCANCHAMRTWLRSGRDGN